VIDLSGSRWVRIETDPYGASVTRAGQPLGETPLELGVVPGDPPLIVMLEGYRLVTITADALLSGESPVRIDLVPAERTAPGAYRTASGSQRADRITPATVILAMLVAGSASAATVFSNEADDTFERYKKTGDLDEMNDLFDEARRLDSLAIVSWIVSEAALGVLLYQLLKEPGRADEAGAQGGTK